MRGLINVQYAVAGTTVYVIEANPRASRTVPFVAKATGVPLAKVATRVMLGATLAELRDEGLLPRARSTGHVAVKEAVLPFYRFPEVDPALGPEMRSTGEVMGIDSTFGRAFFKAELAAGNALPTEGTVFLSLNDHDKPAGLVVAKRLRERGLGLVATKGTADYLASFGVPVDQVLGKVQDGDGGQTAVDLIADGTIVFVVNTPRGSAGRSDGEHIRKAASLHRVSCVTTVERRARRRPGPRRAARRSSRSASLQEYHARDERRHPRPGRVGRAAEPDHDGVGHGRVRRRAGGVPRPVDARRRGHQVARRVRVGRQPGAAAARHAARDDQRRRAAGPGRRRAGSTRPPAGAAAHGRHRGVQHLGPLGRRLPRGGRRARRGAARGGRGRGQPVVPEPRGAGRASSPTTPSCRPR